MQGGATLYSQINPEYVRAVRGCPCTRVGIHCLNEVDDITCRLSKQLMKEEQKNSLADTLLDLSLFERPPPPRRDEGP